MLRPLKLCKSHHAHVFLVVIRVSSPVRSSPASELRSSFTSFACTFRKVCAQTSKFFLNRRFMASHEDNPGKASVNAMHFFFSLAGDLKHRVKSRFLRTRQDRAVIAVIKCQS